MNNLKFRVWEIPTKTMTYLGELLCWEHGYKDNQFTSLNNGFRTGLHQDIFTTDNNEWIKASKERFILQQFTGLLDKNKKEVFAGDIVKGLFSGWIGEIVFDRCRFSLKVKNEYHYLPGIQNLEVVGNIFENPELLNK